MHDGKRHRRGEYSSGSGRKPDRRNAIPPGGEGDSFEKLIASKEKRKLERQRDTRSIWYGLSLFGMVGWTIAVPTVLGAITGIWLDRNYEQEFSWTLSLLVGGLLSGCFFAWKWVQKENRNIMRRERRKDENFSRTAPGREAGNE